MQVRDLARDFFRRGEYVHLNIGSSDLSANHNIRQLVEVVDRRDKVEKLCDVLEKFYAETAESKRDKVAQLFPLYFDSRVKVFFFQVLIFAETKRAVDFLDRLLYKRGFRVAGIHGDKTQRMRDNALRDFR